MNPKRCQTCTVNISWPLLSIEKNPSANNEGASTLFQNLSGSLLKARKFMRDGSICEHFTLQQSRNHLNFLPPYYEVKSWHHAKIELFLTYFSFSLFSETRKSIFEEVRHNLFACLPSNFSYIWHTHVEKTIKVIFLAIFLQ